MLARKKQDRAYRAWRLGDGLPPWYEDHAIPTEEGILVSAVIRSGKNWTIFTMEGTESASDDDWCLEGVRGEYYPMSEGVLNHKYSRQPDGRWLRRTETITCWRLETIETAQMPIWLQECVSRGIVELTEDGLVIHTSWGNQHATIGHDVIILAGENDIYPCKTEVFDQTYEVIEG